jgi:hypothetical protein
MFRRLRYRNWLVAGLGAAALALPTTALAGSDLGAKDNWYGYAVSATTQSRQLSKIDPAIVGYLTRYGFTKSQITAYARPVQFGDVLASQLKMDPARVRYLLRYGFTPSQIAKDSQPGSQGVSQPGVTGNSSGFQWDDFGVGLSAALIALSALGVVRLFSNRGDRQPVTGS